MRIWRKNGAGYGSWELADGQIVRGHITLHGERWLADDLCGWMNYYPTLREAEYALERHIDRKETAS